MSCSANGQLYFQKRRLLSSYWNLCIFYNAVLLECSTQCRMCNMFRMLGKELKKLHISLSFFLKMHSFSCFNLLLFSLHTFQIDTLLKAMVVNLKTDFVRVDHLNTELLYFFRIISTHFIRIQADTLRNAMVVS